MLGQGAVDKIGERGRMLIEVEKSEINTAAEDRETDQKHCHNPNRDVQSARETTGIKFNYVNATLLYINLF